MVISIDSASSDAERAARGNFGAVEELLGRVGGVANSTAVYGQPIERDGVTVVPVAAVRWGGGAGSGSGRHANDDSGEGMGAGGGAMATPVGYIEISGGTARFVRIRDLTAAWPLVIASALGIWVVLRGLRALLR